MKELVLFVMYVCVAAFMLGVGMTIGAAVAAR